MHSTNLEVLGNCLFNPTASQCMGIAYGWVEPAKYDAEGRVSNPEALQPSPEALANAKLWAAAPALLEFYNAAQHLENTLLNETFDVAAEAQAEERFKQASDTVTKVLPKEFAPAGV